jgi:putative transposase
MPDKPLDRIVKDYEAKWPKATEKMTKDRDALLALFDFPAEHWVHLKSTSPIEPTFTPVRPRTNVTRAPDHGPRPGHCLQADRAGPETRWRAVNAPQLVGLVRADVKFEKG